MYLLTQEIVQKDILIVVGNSGITEKDQEFLDKEKKRSDIVRFNNFTTRENIPLTKPTHLCDILVSTLDLPAKGSNPRDVVVGVPFPFQARRNKRLLYEWYPEAWHWQLDPYECLGMNDDFSTGSDGYKHPFPSVGASFLWNIRQWDLPIYIMGFNWYYKNGLFQNWNLANTDYPKHWNHNYPREIQWVIRNLLPRKNVTFSDECMRILKIAQIQIEQQT